MKKLIPFLTFIILISCEYKSEEVYEVLIDENVFPPYFTVMDLSLEKDSFLVLNETLINFDFQTKDNIIYQVIVTIDDYEFHSLDSLSGSFVLNPNELAEGFHSLSLSVITNSNTGSIADILGMEGFQFTTKAWTFYCLNRENKELSYSIESNKESGFEIKWDSCPYNNVNYTVEKYLENENGILVKSFRTIDPIIFDDEYIGENAFYKVFISNEDDSVKALWGIFVLDKDIPMPVIDIIENRIILKCWKSAYYKNLESFKIIDNVSKMEIGVYNQTDTSNYLEQQPTSTNIDIMDAYPFGESLDLSIINVPKNENEFYEVNIDKYSLEYNGVSGLPSINKTGVLSRAYDNLMILEDSKNVRSYDISNDKYVDSVFAKPLSNTDYLFRTSNYYLSKSEKNLCFYYNNRNSIYWGPTNDLRAFETWDSPFEQNRIRTIKMSDADEILIGTVWGIYLFSKNNKSIVDSESYDELDIGGENIYSMQLSSSGEYLILWDDFDFKCFYINNNRFNTQYIVRLGSQTGNYFQIDASNDGRIFFFIDNTVTVRSIYDFSIISSHVLASDTELKIIDVDFYSQNYLVEDFDNKKLLVYRISDGELIFEISVDFYATLSYRLMGNTIWCSKGSKFTITSE